MNSVHIGSHFGNVEDYDCAAVGTEIADLALDGYCVKDGTCSDQKNNPAEIDMGPDKKSTSPVQHVQATIAVQAVRIRQEKLQHDNRVRKERSWSVGVPDGQQKGKVCPCAVAAEPCFRRNPLTDHPDAVFAMHSVLSLC